ncbi:MAG: SH3 domain-containing protein [Pikeienuella sp.]
MRILTALAVILLASVLPAGGADLVAAQDRSTGPVTYLPLPRYVSLNASRINLRRGPGLDYRVDLEYRRKGLPVRVVDEYGQWRQVVDSDGDEGWIFHALLSGRRTVVVTARGVLLRHRPVGLTEGTDCADLAGLPEGAAACAERGVVARLSACERFWCLIEAGGHDGWVPKSTIWGVEPAEVFDD